MENIFDMMELQLSKLVKRRFKAPTPIQKQVIPSVMSGENVITISETGSGKTEAALLPVFNSIVKNSPEAVSALYITPLRSLNRDLMKRILWWANNLGFEVSVRHGDTSQYERSMQAANPSDLMITTPETLQAILTGKIMRKHVSNVRWIIVDEIHELVNSKRGVQLSVGLERLKKLIEKERGERKIQMIGLSATVGSPEEVAEFLTAGKPCRIINTSKEKKTRIIVESPVPEESDMKISREILVSPDAAARIKRIDQLIKKSKSVLVFTNTRESAEVLSSRLRVFNRGLPMETHHSSLSKEVRIRAEKDFKDEKLKVLMCTSSLELGIDIGSIELIIQYMSPRQVAKLLQRTGRAGHTMEKTSKAVIISSDADDCFESAIIAKHALEGLIEPTHVYEKSLDVLGHQIVGMSLEEYMVPFDDVYNTIKKSVPFKELGKEEFFNTCLLMEKLGYLWINQKEHLSVDEFKRSKKELSFKDSKKLVLKRRRKAWEYYYGNLSTIPDTRNYKIMDIISNQSVGSLDAEFIALHGEPGTAFICKGQAWRILELRKDRIIVEPMHGIEAAIPAWEGELIPVPYDVAQDIGRLRKETEKLLGKKNAGLLLAKKYPIAKNVSKKLVKRIKEQAEWGYVSGNNEILIEYATVVGREGVKENYVIMHACFGSLVNDTIGRVLSILLTNRMGSVGLQSDPYRIILKLPVLDWKIVEETLKNLDGNTIVSVLKTTLPSTELFRWRFLHIAKRFGIIAKNADFGKGYLKKIAEVYAGSPPYREALNEIFQEKIDLEKSLEVIDSIRKGKIRILVRKGLSPLGAAGLERRYEIVSQEKPEKEIFDVFKKRLLDTKMGFVCCQCGYSFGGYSVKNVKRVICTRCGARLVSYVPPRWLKEGENLVKKHLKGGSLAGEEKKWLDLMMRTASLIISHELDAVRALAGRGIGPRTASRILAKGSLGEQLLKDILEAERQYAKTKRFWRS